MSVELLKYSLEQKRPNLVLGAGFSLGAKSIKRGEVPIVSKLVENLYQHCFVDNKPVGKIAEDIEDAKEFKNNEDLKQLCSLLREEGGDRLKLRDDYLTDVFYKCSVEENDWHYYIADYPWEKIFTLNIDDLVEFLYQGRKCRLKVWNNNGDDRRNDSGNTLLIKMHGCVNAPEKGYVFDNQEYTQFLNGGGCFLREFGDAFMKRDMIFIGTEFQEQDLWSIIETYKGYGYDLSGNQYFFITPKINNRVFKRWISNNENVHWIKWTTQDFLEFMHDEISVKLEIKKDLKEKGMIFLDEIQEEVSEYYSSSLYTGKESRYADFFMNWDIPYPEIDELVKRIVGMKKNIVVALYGKSYVGKSCCAKRVLVDLWNRNYVCVQFEMRSSEYMQRFIDYLKTLPKGTNVAVLFEEASFYYNLLYNKLLLNCPPNIKQLIVVTTDNIVNHVSKRALLRTKGCLVDFQIYETISYTYAYNIYNKLKDKNWIGRLLNYCESEKGIPKYAREVNDIIEFLYHTSYGKGFENYYADLLSRNTNEVYLKYLYALCTLEVLGVDSIPQRIIPGLLPKYKKMFNFQDFLCVYDDVLIVENNRVKVRCLRLMQKVINADLTVSDSLDLLQQVVLHTVGQFNEGDVNEWTELFQKALLVKRLQAENILEIQDILLLLQSVEAKCEQYSYYWIQRGIAEQKVFNFENADNYFRKATRIRPQSYQARHALAKNLMERGIDELKQGNSSYAPYYFSEGKSEMKNIIEDNTFSRAYRYSVHAYIDLELKYLKIAKRKMNVDEVIYIQSKILKIKQDELDSYMVGIINNFIKYCDTNGFEIYCYDVKEIDWNKTILIESERSDYEIENLDLLEGLN